MTMIELRAERERLQICLIFGNDPSVKPRIREITELMLILQRTECDRGELGLQK